MNKKQTQLEQLFAWSEFYRANEQWDSYARIQKQIENFNQ